MCGAGRSRHRKPAEPASCCSQASKLRILQLVMEKDGDRTITEPVRMAAVCPCDLPSHLALPFLHHSLHCILQINYSKFGNGGDN
jgi:hypothetical protein